MNTHSKEGDCRMEILVAAAVRQHVPVECLEAILDCVTTEEAVRILNTCDKKDAVMSLDFLKRLEAEGYVVCPGHYINKCFSK